MQNNSKSRSEPCYDEINRTDHLESMVVPAETAYWVIKNCHGFYSCNGNSTPSPTVIAAMELFPAQLQGEDLLLSLRQFNGCLAAFRCAPTRTCLWVASVADGR